VDLSGIAAVNNSGNRFNDSLQIPEKEKSTIFNEKQQGHLSQSN
jgi:hypothetical protein